MNEIIFALMIFFMGTIFGCQIMDFLWIKKIRKWEKDEILAWKKKCGHKDIKDYE